MSISTKTKTEYLERYCKRNFLKWRQTISPNIVGVHVGYKKCKGRTTNRFSIVFHVKQKLEFPVSHIPRKFHLTIKKQRVSVPTDVVETGSTKLLNVFMGDKARSRAAGVVELFGAAGLFVKIKEDTYLISNMHVLAPQRLAERTYRCPRDQQFSSDVECFNDEETERAFLQKAEFDKTDLAMARLRFPDHATFKIRRLGQPGPFLKQADIARGMPVQMFGANSNKRLRGVIEEIAVSRIVEYDSLRIEIQNLIATSIPVIKGDSGSAVVNDSLEVVGILVSKDDHSSYVIPSFEIEKFIRTA